MLLNTTLQPRNRHSTIIKVLLLKFHQIIIFYIKKKNGFEQKIRK